LKFPKKKLSNGKDVYLMKGTVKLLTRYMALIERPRKVKVSYQNEKGTVITEELSELFSRIFLHEYDHLEGKVFLNEAIQRVEIKKLENPDYNDQWMTEQEEKNLLI
jgi:hypothetical protein